MPQRRTHTLRGRRRRPGLGAAAGIATFLLLAAGAVLPPSFVTDSAGPTFNTIGDYEGKQLIGIEGMQTYPTEGNLDLTTVFVSGGPNGPTSALSVLGAWLDPGSTAFPSDAVYSPELTTEDVSSQNAAEMTDSQSAAQAAAASHLGLDYTETLRVTGAAPDAAASDLGEDDVLLALDGRPIEGLDQLGEALQQGGGAPVSLTYRTPDGQERTSEVTPQRDGSSGRYLLGLYLQRDFDFPFDVTYGLEQVGGPSAGTMFALGIVDELTEGSMTGGEHFAGTGTIDAEGKVGSIGGIRQKLIGARDAGASVFIAPSENCDEVSGHVPDGLSVVEVHDLDEAADAVQRIGAGEDPASFPHCENGSAA
ncbi:PDZ domain-containing protein [Rothia halotolerans]|uniref:YlbL family protein n=1 Tax=Rothia halotolerans TaxID=405770 RepID=UPI00101BF2E8|nr:S16 family serine protease [Rothia halotolerans]